MKQDLILKYEDLYFVPYSKMHVGTYHEWMQDPELLIATASDPLTLEEEYLNQISWATDLQKYTFILEIESDTKNGYKGTMIGDVNLFLQGDQIAEIEIMIARRDFQRLGLGTRSVVGMMYYGMKHLNINRFISKIRYTNIPSQNLFHKIGFLERSRSEYFREVELAFEINQEVKIKYLSLPITEETFTDN